MTQTRASVTQRFRVIKERFTIVRVRAFRIEIVRTSISNIISKTQSNVLSHLLQEIRVRHASMRDDREIARLQTEMNAWSRKRELVVATSSVAALTISTTTMSALSTISSVLMQFSFFNDMKSHFLSFVIRFFTINSKYFKQIMNNKFAFENIVRLVVEFATIKQFVKFFNLNNVENIQLQIKQKNVTTIDIWKLILLLQSLDVYEQILLFEIFMFLKNSLCIVLHEYRFRLVCFIARCTWNSICQLHLITHRMCILKRIMNSTIWSNVWSDVEVSWLQNKSATQSQRARTSVDQSINLASRVISRKNRSTKINIFFVCKRYNLEECDILFCRFRHVCHTCERFHFKKKCKQKVSFSTWFSIKKEKSTNVCLTNIFNTLFYQIWDAVDSILNVESLIL